MDFFAHRGNSVASGNSGLFPVVSPDGKIVLAGCDRDSFGLWDVSAGKWLLRFSCEQFLPHHPTFSPNGDLLTLLDTHGDPCLVDAATGRLRRRLTWKNGDLSWILESVRAFSPDSRLLAAAYDPHTLVLWETATGRLIRTWPGHGRGQLRQMAFSPDRRRLATASRDGTALVWDVTGLSPDGQLPNRKLTAAQTKQSWKDLADADAAKAHRALWSLVADPERSLPLLREHLRPIRGIEPHRLTQLISDLDDDDFSVRETATNKLRKLSELALPALRATLKGRSSLELRRRVQGLIEEMDRADLSAERQLDLRASVAFSPDGRYVAVGCQHPHLLLFDLATGKEVRRFPTDAYFGNIAFSPDNRTLATGDGDGELFLWELAGGRRRHRFVGHESAIKSLAFSPDGRLLAASSYDAPAFVWDLFGTSEAVRLLGELADGAADARLTREASAAKRRLIR